MGKFGLKKSGDGDEESGKRALFGMKKKNKGPAPINPYAKEMPIDPYTRAKINAGVAPPPKEELVYPGQKPPAGTPPAGPPSIPPTGYAPNRYGSPTGYGNNRFGGRGSVDPGPRYGAGGYGGLGSVDPNNPSESDADRDALFGGARERMEQHKHTGHSQPSYSDQENNAFGGGTNEYSTAMYQERQLTAEEEEEEDIKAIKEEMKFVKQGDVSSSRNAIRAAAQAEEVGRDTLARLGYQGERIHDTEHNLDVAGIESRIAEEKAKELNTLNKSMFHVHVANPFTSARRKRDRDMAILNTNREDRGNRDATRHEAYMTNQRMDRNFRDIDRQSKASQEKQKKHVLERKKYQFEADSEDEAMEDEIDQNLNLLGGASGRLNGLARATNNELDEQNRHLERIIGKVSPSHLYSLRFSLAYANPYYRAIMWTTDLP